MAINLGPFQSVSAFEAGGFVDFIAVSFDYTGPGTPPSFVGYSLDATLPNIMADEDRTPKGAFGNVGLAATPSGAGAYCKSVYNAGGIAVGLTLAYAVGAAGISNKSAVAPGGDGGAGRIRFTVA